MARKKKSFDDHTPDDQLTDAQYLERHSKSSWDQMPISKWEGVEYTPKASVSVPFKKCLDSHPAIVIGACTIYGGSCSEPRIKDAHIYVGLDWGAKPVGKYPWLLAAGEAAQVNIHYQISDMCAPADPVEFKVMVDWLCNQLHAGQRLHIGCIGGHGRTGLLISAILSTLWDKDWEENDPMLQALCNLPDQHMLESRDFIKWVRTHYCTKAVESNTQIAFLMHHYKTLSAHPGKEHGPVHKQHKAMPAKSYGSKAPTMDLTPANRYASAGGQTEMYKSFSSSSSSSMSRVVKPVTSNKNVWITKKV